VSGSVVLSLALSWTTTLGRQFDNYAYDFLFRQIQPAPWQPASLRFHYFPENSSPP